jgi:hypothetical protein
VRRILLAIEDYNELVFCETILKKIGFDTQSYQTELAISESLISFRPDLLIMTAAGTRVNGLNYLQKLKTKYAALPVVLVGLRKTLNVKDKQIVALLEPPVSPRLLIEVMASLFGMDEEPMIVKFERATDSKKASKDQASVYVTGSDWDVTMRLFKEKTKQAPDAVQERALRYKKIAEATSLPEFQGINKDLLKDQVKEFRAQENTEEVAEIDEERRMFAIELARRSKRTKQV